MLAYDERADDGSEDIAVSSCRIKFVILRSSERTRCRVFAGIVRKVNVTSSLDTYCTHLLSKSSRPIVVMLVGLTTSYDNGPF